MSVYPRIAGRLIRPPTALIEMGTSLFSLHGKICELLPLERVLATVFLKEPDRVPVVHFLLGGARKFTGITYEDLSRHAEKAAEAYLAVAEMLGSDSLYNVIDLSVEAADFGQELIYPPHSTAHPDYLKPRIAEPEDYERLEVFDPRKSPRMSTVIELGRILSKKAKLRYPVMGFIFGPLGVLAMMRGAQRLFVDCLKYPSKVKAGLEIVTEVLVDYARAQCDTGVDTVMLDTLFAAQSGISRELWKEMEGPYCRRIADEIRRCGALVTLHNCGNAPYFDLQIEYMEPVLISFAHLPDDCRNNRELKEKYGGRVALAGYIPTDSICLESPRGIMEIAREQIRDLAPGGGFVLAPGCEYPPNVDILNALAISKAAQTYGKYPIKVR